MVICFSLFMFWIKQKSLRNLERIVISKDTEVKVTFLQTMLYVCPFSCLNRLFFFKKGGVSIGFCVLPWNDGFEHDDAQSVADLFGPHEEICDVMEQWTGRFRPGDEEDENEYADGFRGEGSALLNKLWFKDGKEPRALLLTSEKMNPVPYIGWKQVGEWTLAVVSGVVYT